MRSKWVRIISMALVGTMLLTGCGAAGGDKKEDSKDEKREVSDNLNKEGLPILKEKETFTIAVPQKSTLKSAAEKECVKAAEEATNVHIEWVEIPASGWKEKINIMFSTDSLPDAIIGAVDMAKNYEQLAELDEMLKEYAPNTTAFFESRDDYPTDLYSPDGKIHTLPTGDEAIQNIIDSQLWINQKWLDNLGLQMPTTIDEFKEVLIAFRDKDPNGNGKADEIPFTFRDAWGWGGTIENLFGPFGVLETASHVFTKDGKVTFSAAEQGYYDALEWMNGLYKEGLFDKEAFTLSGDQYASRGAAGDNLGVVAGYRANEAGVVNETDYRAVPVLKGKDGTQMIGTNNVTRTGGFVISKTCKNPEALVRWYDYINSSLELALDWGRGAEDVTWRILEQDGEQIPQFITMDETTLKENGGYQSKAEYRNAESFSGDTPSLWKYEYAQKVITDENCPPDYKLEAVNDQMQYGVMELPSGTATLENSERRTILLADIDNYLKKFIADSVINGIDEGKWEEHQKTLKSLKVEEYTKLCQEFVDSLETDK